MLGKVMLVDDDAFCNRMNAFVLEQHGAAEAIITFYNAKDALDYLSELIQKGDKGNFPNIVLLDLNMANIDGWEFLDLFKALPARYTKKTGVYILTSSIQASDREAATLRTDIRGYIEKPFTSKELEFVISNQRCLQERNPLVKLVF